VNTFLEVFFSFVAGGITLWGLLVVHERVKQRRGDRAWLRDKGVQQNAYTGLRAMGTKLEQTASRLSKPHVAPPPAPLPPPHPQAGWGNWPPPVPAPRMNPAPAPVGDGIADDTAAVQAHGIKPWPYYGKHAPAAEETAAMPPAHPPIDPKGY
jgi:hypothetical protein